MAKKRVREMAENKKKANVRIFGEEYTLKGRANPEYMKELAHSVEASMREIKERNPKLTSTQVAVLAAVNIADLYFTSRWNEKGWGTGVEDAGKAGEGGE
ncbi:MAG: cell division protein ZapA [bacterium]